MRALPANAYLVRWSICSDSFRVRAISCSTLVVSAFLAVVTKRTYP